MGGDYVTLNQLVTAFNRTGSYSYKMISWVENRGLPVHNKRVQQNTFRVVYYRSRYIDAAKTAQYIEIGQISAGDAEHVTTLCKKAAIEYKTAA